MNQSQKSIVDKLNKDNKFLPKDINPGLVILKGES